jgi:hypothetical protein
MVALTQSRVMAEQLGLKSGDRVVLTRIDGSEEVRTVAIGPKRCQVSIDADAGTGCPGQLGVASRWVIWLVGIRDCLPLRMVRPLRTEHQETDHAERLHSPLATLLHGTAGGRSSSPKPRFARRRLFVMGIWSLGCVFWAIVYYVLFWRVRG